MSQYFSTIKLTGGFLSYHPKLHRYTPVLKALLIALSGSFFIYSAYWHYTSPLLNTLAGLFALYALLRAEGAVWFWSGSFFGLFWFWWIGLSFVHYQMHWAIPLVELGIALIYGGLFWLIAKIALSAKRLAFRDKSIATQRIPTLLTLILKALGLLMLSYIHPFGFDWFKPELLFVQSYFGIEKWRFAVILTALVLLIWKRNPLVLIVLLLAYAPDTTKVSYAPLNEPIALVTIMTPVEQKWDEKKHARQFAALFTQIQEAIDAKKETVVLPESVFPVFLNYNATYFDHLHQLAKKINIVTGALYLDEEKVPRNATYIFTKEGKVQVANKVILVPFGEANPLPDFLSDWVNRIFYDGAVDYKAAADISDYELSGKRYRNAICFEATSERLYKGVPERMIVLSNNGWFTPSIEPTLQQLLLQYYSRKYGTTIYHAVNGSPSYRIAPKEP